MSREIKFRVWDREACEWKYAEPIFGFFSSLPMDEEDSVNKRDRYGDIQTIYWPDRQERETDL